MRESREGIDGEGVAMNEVKKAKTMARNRVFCVTREFLSIGCGIMVSNLHFFKANSEFGTSRCLQQTFKLWLKLRERGQKKKHSLWGVWILEGKEVRYDEYFCLVYKRMEKENVYFTFMALKK